MELSTPRGAFDQVAAYVREAAGEYAWNLAVREARRQGANARQAIDSAVHRLSQGRVGPPNTRNRKRDIFGDIKPKKLNFDNPSTMSGEDINFKRSKMSLGRPKKRSATTIFNAQIGSMKEVIWRWQSCSASLMGPGRVPIGFGNNSVTQPDTLVMPMHMMSLTTNPQFAVDNQLGCRDKGMFRFVYRRASTSIGAFGYQFLASQENTGAVGATGLLGQWHLESGSVMPAVNQVFHKYTDIRLNLYGSLSYPLTYRVMVVKALPVEMQPLEFDPVTSTVGTNPLNVDFPIFTTTPLNEFIMDHVRPIVTNPIIGSTTDKSWKGKFKVVSDKSYKIPCLSYGSLAGEQTSTINSTNVRSVNMFIRHDKFNDYGWRSMPGDIQRNEDIGGVGWSKTDVSLSDSVSLLTDLDREERMFLVISCNAPELVNSAFSYNVTSAVGGPTTDSVAAVPNFGTYDIVVRNCFREGSQN